MTEKTVETIIKDFNSEHHGDGDGSGYGDGNGYG